VGVSRHGAEEEASEASARRLWGFCVFGASGACGGGAAKMAEETKARKARQTHTFWCASLSERDAWLACLSQSIERAVGMPPLPFLPHTGWEASGRDLVEELVDLAMATCTNATKAGAAACSAGSWDRKAFADLVEACAALACDLAKDPAHARVPGHGCVGASVHRGVQRGGVTGCDDPGEPLVSKAQQALPRDRRRDQLLLHAEEDTYRLRHEEEDTHGRRDHLRLHEHVKDVAQHEEDTCIVSEAAQALRRDQLRLDAQVQALLFEKQALLAEKEALQQVSFASMIGLVCLYTRPRLPTRSVLALFWVSFDTCADLSALPRKVQ
jgi:hypothetical protein